MIDLNQSQHTYFLFPYFIFTAKLRHEAHYYHISLYLHYSYTNIAMKYNMKEKVTNNFILLIHIARFNLCCVYNAWGKVYYFKIEYKSVSYKTNT